MTDFTKLPAKIVQLLTVVFNTSSSDGERVNALRAFDRFLKSTGADGHELVEWIQMTPVTDEELQKTFDAGIEQGRAAEALEQQRRAFAPVPRSFFGLGGNYDFDDFDRLSGHDTFNGYRWSDIAEHCAIHSHRIPAKHHGFLGDMARKLMGRGTMSGSQARYLGNLFNQYLSGRV